MTLDLSEDYLKQQKSVDGGNMIIDGSTHLRDEVPEGTYLVCDKVAELLGEED